MVLLTCADLNLMLWGHSRKSPQLRCARLGPINVERIHLVSHPTGVANLNAPFTLLVPKE